MGFVRSLSLVVMLGACSFSPSTGNLGDATQQQDAPGVDAADRCYGPNGWTVCPRVANDHRQITGAINTDEIIYCSPTQLDSWPAPQPAACFVVGRTLTLTNVTASGSRPLVLVASDTITINGVLDVASHRGGTIGPGSQPTACKPFTGTPENSGNGGGGGAGGSFGTAGGDGGQGDSSRQGGQAAAANNEPPTVLRAGCAGQRGGEDGGAPGRGGGAVYLVAGISIGGPGTIHAGGSGGTSANSSSGGSGAGTGGMIVLAAPVISLGGAVANGGGGASGASNSTGGTSGSDVDPLLPMAPALGGEGPGGRGGDGSFATTPAVDGSDVGNDRGGGGGGGGVGAIRSNLPLSFPVSPPASIIP